nr:hypothetical protein [Pandoravirus massiliensis]
MFAHPSIGWLGLFVASPFVGCRFVPTIFLTLKNRHRTALCSHMDVLDVDVQTCMDTANDQVGLAWSDPALSLAAERVFEFYIADHMSCLSQRPSVVARVEIARWLAKAVKGPLRASREFRAAARRATSRLRLCYRHFGDLCVHQWPGLAGLDRPVDDGSARGSVTFVVGLPGSGKTYASTRLCAAMTQAMARASGRLNAPCVRTHAMIDIVHRPDGQTIDQAIAEHLAAAPYARAVSVEDRMNNHGSDIETLRERGFHVMLYQRRTISRPFTQNTIDRVLVALGPRGSSCRSQSLSEYVAALVGGDAAALDALFAAAPSYTYIWFEPVDGRFGPGRTVMTHSRISDFETADGSAPPLNPRYFFCFVV